MQATGADGVPIFAQITGAVDAGIEFAINSACTGCDVEQCAIIAIAPSKTDQGCAVGTDAVHAFFPTCTVIFTDIDTVGATCDHDLGIADVVEQFMDFGFTEGQKASIGPVKPTIGGDDAIVIAIDLNKCDALTGNRKYPCKDRFAISCGLTLTKGSPAGSVHLFSLHTHVLATS